MLSEVALAILFVPQDRTMFARQMSSPGLSGIHSFWDILQIQDPQHKPFCTQQLPTPRFLPCKSFQAPEAYPHLCPHFGGLFANTSWAKGHTPE